MGWRAAVAAAVAVVVRALAAGPLYASSSGNAALARELDGRCPASLGTQLSAGPDLGSGVQPAVAGLNEAAASIPRMLPATITRATPAVPVKRVDEANAPLRFADHARAGGTCLVSTHDPAFDADRVIAIGHLLR